LGFVSGFWGFFACDKRVSKRLGDRSLIIFGAYVWVVTLANFLGLEMRSACVGVGELSRDSRVKLRTNGDEQKKKELVRKGMCQYEFALNFEKQVPRRIIHVALTLTENYP